MQEKNNGKEGVTERQNRVLEGLGYNLEEMNRKNYSKGKVAFAYARAAKVLESKGDHEAAGRAYLHAVRYGRDAKFKGKSPADHFNDSTIAEWRREGERELYRADSFPDKKSLSHRALVSVAVVGLFGASFFLLQNFTGNVIGNAGAASNWIGGILFIIGALGTFLYFRKK